MYEHWRNLNPRWGCWYPCKDVWTSQVRSTSKSCVPTLWSCYPNPNGLLTLAYISSLSSCDQTIMLLLRKSFTPSLSLEPFVQLIAVLSGPPIVRPLCFRDISWYIIVAPNWLNWWCLKCHPGLYCDVVYWCVLNCTSIHFTELHYAPRHCNSLFFYCFYRTMHSKTLQV